MTTTTKLNDAWGALIDALVPAPYRAASTLATPRDHERVAAVRLLASGCVVIAAAALFWALAAVASGRPAAGIPYYAATAVLGSFPWLFRRTESVSLIAHLTVGLGMITVSVNPVVSAELLLARVFTFVALILFIITLLGWRAGAAWLVVAVGASLGLAARLVPTGAPSGLTQAQVEVSTAISVVCIGLMMFGLAAAAWQIRRTSLHEAARVQRELMEARAAAEASDRAKSAFLANMSHELRTPMTGIIGMTDILLDTAPTEEQREYLLVVRSSSEALLSILNDVLDLSKVEAGRVALEAVPFGVSEVVGQVAALLEVPASSKGLALQVDVDAAVAPTRVGDPMRLRQVLLNLGANAVKFTTAGAVEVRVGPGASCPDAVRFEVRDEGIGIAPEQLDAVFEPFTQAESSTTRRFGGTGLGLSVSRELVALMGGALTATSRPGEGSTFAFEVPLPLAPAGGEGRELGAIADQGVRTTLPTVPRA